MNFSKHGDPVSVSTASRRASQSRIGASVLCRPTDLSTPNKLNNAQTVRASTRKVLYQDFMTQDTTKGKQELPKR